MKSNIKTACVLIIIFLMATSCKEENESLALTADLTIKFKYKSGAELCELENAIKVNLFAGDQDIALFENIYSDADGKIYFDKLVQGNYLLEYYVKPDCKDFWPIPHRKTFQIIGGENKLLELN